MKKLEEDMTEDNLYMRLDMLVSQAIHLPEEKRDSIQKRIRKLSNEYYTITGKYFRKKD